MERQRRRRKHGQPQSGYFGHDRGREQRGARGNWEFHGFAPFHRNSAAAKDVPAFH
jgi:hypothetical protein